MSQPPITPGPPPYTPPAGGPYSGPPASPAPYGPFPPPGGAFSPPPPRKKSFWSSTGGVLTIIGLAVGLPVLICFGVAFARVLGGASASNLDASIVSCEFTGGSLSSAKVGVQVKNNGDRAETAAVKIEYRDGSGNRIDTDTAYVRNIQPGDTARVDETTILDAEVTSAGSCRIVGVS